MINLYDFDHTIYRGDASLDFIRYYLIRHPKLWYKVFSYIVVIAQYILGVKSRKQVKERAFSFLKDVADVDTEVEKFWEQHESRIVGWYRARYEPSDVIISASPEFLLQPIADKLGVEKVIATRMSKTTGHIEGENCRGEEKVRRLKLLGIHNDICNVYSDSQSDRPILSLAKGSGYIVRGSEIIPQDKYTPSRFSTIKSARFIRFVFIGGVNATLGIGFSYFFLYIVNNPQLAFVTGFFASLCVAYFLNSIVVFKDRKYSFRKFIAFVISYLPNFVIQFISVYVFVTVLHLSPLIAYILAVVVAVPVTFLLLSSFVFNKSKT